MTQVIKITEVTLESEVLFYQSGELKDHNGIIGWTLTIEASDNKRYIYTEDESMYSTKELFKDFVLGEIHSDLGETAYYQLTTIINKL